MQDQERYLQQLDHIVVTNELKDAELQELVPWVWGFGYTGTQVKIWFSYFHVWKKKKPGSYQHEEKLGRNQVINSLLNHVLLFSLKCQHLPYGSVQLQRWSPISEAEIYHNIWNLWNMIETL